MIVTDGLVLYLHGACGKNNPATRVWKDLSGNGNDGQLINFGFTEDSGWVDGGLRFDGVDDYVNTGFRIEGFNNYTISITFKFISHKVGVASSIIQSAGTKGRIMMVGNIQGNLTINTWFGSGMDFWHISSYKVTVDEIVNMVATFDRQGFKRMYINGELYGEKDISSAKEVPWNGTVLNIGKPDSYYKNTNIEVYDCKIYNRALTDEEILQNYQAGHEWTPQIGKREVTTTMKPITSSLSRKGKGKRELISTMKPITTSLERKGVGKREVITTMKPITSSLSRKGVGKREVTTTIKPITSSISKKLPPIHVDMDIRERTPNITIRERIPKLEVD